MENKYTVKTILLKNGVAIKEDSFDYTEDVVVTPPPEPQTETMRVVATGGLNVRRNPSINAPRAIDSSGKNLVLSYGTEVSILIPRTIADGYAWVQLADKSGYVAEGSWASGSLQVRLLEPVTTEEPTYPPAKGRNVKTVRQSDGVNLNSPTSQPDGRARTGMNIRGLFNLEPAIRDEVIKDTIDAANRFKFGVIRAYAAHKNLSPEQSAANTVYTLNQFKVLYNDELKVYPIQFLICFTDSMSHSDAYIRELEPFHTGEIGHLNALFYSSTTGRTTYLNWIERYLKALQGKGIDDLIVGFELINESQLAPRRVTSTGIIVPTERTLANAANVTDLYHMAAYKVKTIYPNKAVSSGLRTVWDITASDAGESQYDRAKTLYKNNVFDIVSVHAYTVGRDQQGYKVDKVQQPIHEWDYLKLDLRVARELGLVGMVGEYSSLNTTWADYVSAGIHRNAVDAYAYDLFDAEGVWAILGWALQAGLHDRNVGDRIGGFDAYFDNIAYPGIMDTVYNRAVKYWTRGQ